MTSQIANIAFALAIPIAIAAALTLGPKRAVFGGFVLGWLFLPVALIPVSGLPDLTKPLIVALATTLAALVAGTGALLRVRPAWIDAPVLVLVATPFLSSLSNGLGPYDGVATSFEMAILWLFPWVLGRAFGGDPASARRLLAAMLVGVALYVPLCLYEIRMSPQLHSMVYGYFPHQFAQTFRFGGWRPNVFLNHGLAVGLTMCSGAILAFWCWRRRVLRQIAGIPVGPLAAVIAVTAVLCKSLGALVVAMTVLGIAMLARQRVGRWAMVLFLSGPLAYAGVRMAGLWDGDQALSLARLVSEDRAVSLQTRLDAEDVLMGHALRRPLLGWGGWGRNRVYTEDGYDAAITDGYWVIILGKHGLLGLGSFFAAFLLPSLVYLRRARGDGRRPGGAPEYVIMILLIGMFMVDSLMNTMPNPLYGVLAGAVGSAVLRQRTGAPARAARRPTMARVDAEGRAVPT